MTNDNPQLDELKEAIIQSLVQQELPKLSTPPDILPVFPVLKRPFFPGMAAPVVLEAGAYYELIKKMVKKDDKWVCFLLTKDEKASPYKLEPSDLFSIGVMARIIKVIPMDQGGAQLIVNMEKRVIATEFIKEGKLLRTKVEYHTDQKLLSREMKAYSASITSSIKELLKLNPLFKEELQLFLNHSDLSDPGSLADFAVSMTTATR
ncbi:MAG: LON peptidase substrate-binding domain-containing protein, partial [Parachlamydiaceae bacterium]